MSDHQFQTVNIKGKEYVQVPERISYFRTHSDYKGWSLRTRIIKLDESECIFEAVIRNSSGEIKATGLAHEVKQNSYINKTSYIENCETSAWGRALGNLGIGIKTSIASAEEVSNAIRQQRENDRTARGTNPQAKTGAKQVVPDQRRVEKQPQVSQQPNEARQVVSGDGAGQRPDQLGKKETSKNENNNWVIGEAEIKLLNDMETQAGVEHALKKALTAWGYNSVNELTKHQYEGLVGRFGELMKKAKPSRPKTVSEARFTIGE